ncbi:MAG: NAD-dependent epimerase/dehydratase family protein [Alphaproteobacteria bacterium]|nr:NAD-dependent epimerase/dehydratase family protein [Alphaproteobacteria bacterium]
MKVIITGGGGFLGSRLTDEIIKRGSLVGISGRGEAVTEIVLFDIVEPPPPREGRVKVLTGDIGDLAQAYALIGPDTASVFHLGALVSGGAEANFDLGYRSNLYGTMNVLEACRRLPHRPRLIFTSSVAVYGGKLPAVVTDDTAPVPQTSYGVQKLCGEHLINDYSRKGFLDGRSMRLPAIVVRPGKPNTAASSWCSGVIREPLSGVATNCPVAPETGLPCLSPRRVMEAFIAVHEAPAEALGHNRTVLLPGLTVTAHDMVAAAERHAGNRRFGQVSWQRDPFIQNIVDGWPKALSAARAASLGIKGDDTIDEIVRGFVEDYLETQIALARAG